MNTAEQSSTKRSPAFLNLGREPRSSNTIEREENISVPIDKMSVEQWKNRVSRLHALRDLVSKFQFEASEKQAKYYNATRREVKFNIGDLVWKRKKILSSAINFVAAKLVKKFDGPYRITKLRSPVVVELETLDGKNVGKAHIKDLKLKVCKTNQLSLPPTPSADEPVPSQHDNEAAGTVSSCRPGGQPTARPGQQPRRGRPPKSDTPQVPLGSGTAGGQPPTQKPTPDNAGTGPNTRARARQRREEEGGHEGAPSPDG